MKNRTLQYILVFILLFGFNGIYAQCTPGDEESCPDPEGNGQMCPEELNPVFIGIDYHQEVTILAPIQLDTLDLSIPVHHLTLIDVENLPEGIEWVSNAENNEFMAGLYYCMLLSGTTMVEEANYPLKIIIDVYADVQGVPVKVAQLADSTTLSLDVQMNPDGVGENLNNQLITKMWPNPVSDIVNLELQSSITGKISVELFDIMGKLVFTKQIEKSYDNPYVSINLKDMPSGVYLMSVKNNNKRFTQLITVSRR